MPTLVRLQVQRVAGRGKPYQDPLKINVDNSQANTKVYHSPGDSSIGRAETFARPAPAEFLSANAQGNMRLPPRAFREGVRRTVLQSEAASSCILLSAMAASFFFTTRE